MNGIIRFFMRSFDSESQPSVAAVQQPVEPVTAAAVPDVQPQPQPPPLTPAEIEAHILSNPLWSEVRKKQCQVHALQKSIEKSLDEMASLQTVLHNLRPTPRIASSDSPSPSVTPPKKEPYKSFKFIRGEQMVKGMHSEQALQDKISECDKFISEHNLTLEQINKELATLRSEIHACRQRVKTLAAIQQSGARIPEFEAHFKICSAPPGPEGPSCGLVAPPFVAQKT